MACNSKRVKVDSIIKTRNDDLVRASLLSIISNASDDSMKNQYLQEGIDLL